MPLVDNPGTSQVYWTTEDVLDFARVLVNDAQGGIAGQDLADTEPFTWKLLNLCYAKLQNWLEDSNVEAATYAEWRIGPLPVSSTAGSDPSMLCRLGYDGFYDGDEQRYDTPTLPPDMLQPLQLWERQGGATMQPFREMEQKQGGLGNWASSGPYRFWEFREQAIYMPASTFGNELRIRGIPALPILAAREDDAVQTIPLARAGEALAYMVAAEFAEIRNAANAPVLRLKANEQLNIISNRSAKRSNQTQQRRRGYGFGRSHRWR